MQPSPPSLRAVVPLVTVGLMLVVVSLFLVGRDVTFTRVEAEAEVLAFAEAGALAIQFAPATEIEPYVKGLLKHPAITTATVYSPDGGRTTRTRPIVDGPPLVTRIVPGLEEAIVGCRSVGTKTFCVEGDASYYRKRLAALLLPHLILLGASALLLFAAMVLARGNSSRRIAELARIVSGAADENNYALRAGEARGETGILAGAINRLLEQMQQRDLILRRRTTELEAVNGELEAFSYSVSHDLRSPLASVDGFSQALSETNGDRLDESGKEYLKWIQEGTEQMKDLVAGLLQMSRITRSELNRQSIDLSRMAQSIAESLRMRDPNRPAGFEIEPGIFADGDERLIHAVLENLMSNAYKFTGKNPEARIAIGVTAEQGRRTYFVKDNGAGFDSSQGARLFTPFQRLHSSSEFEGTGIGLATVKRIIERHGGAIWADGQVGRGATFFFTLGESPAGEQPAEVTEMTRA